MKKLVALVWLLASLAALGVLVLPPLPPAAAPPRAFGWVDDRDQVRAVAATLPDPDFRDTEAYLAPYEGPDDVFLWEAARKVLGKLIPPRDQKDVGACVGFGTTAAVEHLICVQIANGAAEEYRDVAQEVVYGGSRVQVGGGQIRGDGSVGAWAAKFVSEYGVLPRGAYPASDLRAYDVARCRDFGRRGVPAELQPEAKKHPVKSIANVRSWAEAKAAIRNGYPLAVCSSQGFRMARDGDGFCPPQGTWMHCMALVGVRGGPRPGGFLVNSWGEKAHTGPLGVGDPSPAGFWADAAVLDRMLRQGDSWAFSNFQGFPAKRLDWYAKSSLRSSGLQVSSHRTEGLPCVRY